MNPTLNILGISGSLRAQSRNTGLLRFAKQCLPPTVNFQIADLADVPFYNADRCDSKPEPVQTLIRQVTEADALVLACPEYNYSLAPALKNALDWVSREPDCAPFNGKPVAIMGAGGGMGTSRAVSFAAGLRLFEPPPSEQTGSLFQRLLRLFQRIRRSH